MVDRLARETPDVAVHMLPMPSAEAGPSAPPRPEHFRHTFASIAGELGYSELTIAGLLGHGKRGVTQSYIHIDDLLRSAADAVAAKIAAVLDGKERRIAPRRRTVSQVPTRPASRSVPTEVDDNMLIATLAAQFAGGGIDADQLRSAVARLTAG